MMQAPFLLLLVPTLLPVVYQTHSSGVPQNYDDGDRIIYVYYTRSAIQIDPPDSNSRREVSYQRSSPSIPLLEFRRDTGRPGRQESIQPTKSDNAKVTFPNSPVSNYGQRRKVSNKKEFVAADPLVFEKDPSNPNNILQVKGRSDLNHEKNFFANDNVPGKNYFVDHNFEDATAPTISSGDAINTLDLTLNVVNVALKLLNTSELEDSNLVFSPISVANVLSILMLGAKGETFNELAKQLNRNNPLEGSESERALRYHTAFQKLLRYLQVNSGEEVTLEIASEVFADKRFPIEKSFVQNAKTFYDAPVESFDFGNNGDTFVKKVNSWVQEKTRGKITSVLDQVPSSETTMSFINACYFIGRWETPFLPEYTREQDFFINEKETVKVKMMLNIVEIPYINTEFFEMIAIPYKDAQTGFFIMLQKGNDGVRGLRNVETKVSTAVLRQSIHNMTLQNVTVKMPKMKVEGDGHMEEIFRKLDISSMFDSRNANFSGISDTHGLYVSSILHKAKVEISEKGTEAAAVSFASVDRLLGQQPIPFTVNKPFSFFIYHIKAQSVLFFGRVTRPEAFE